jgi:2-oxoglutarate dehydrogenase E1 component
MAVNTTVEVTMPAMGDSVSEGTVLEWHKQEGDQVAEDEVLVEISTDKVDAEVPAPAAGTRPSWNVRPRPGRTPRKARPSRMVSTPRIRVMSSAWSNSSAPIPPKNAPAAMNTTVKPAMKSRLPASMAPRAGRVRSASAVPPPEGAGSPVRGSRVSLPDMPAT